MHRNARFDPLSLRNVFVIFSPVEFDYAAMDFSSSDEDETGWLYLISLLTR